ncbi:MAG TPA: VC0807 family protein [Opitutaceae bacterium]
MNTPEHTPSRWDLWRPYVFDLVGPYVAYLIVHALGVGGVWALTLAGIVSAGSTLVNTIKNRGMDSVGMLVLLEILASLGILLFVHDQRLMLVRPSIYTGIASVYMIYSALFSQPLTYAGSRQMAAQGGPARLAAFARAWNESEEFRRTHRFLTFGFGVGLAIDSILRVLIVYHAPIDRSAWLSNIPHLTAMALFIAISALAGRRFRRLVDQYQNEPTAAVGKSATP